MIYDHNFSDWNEFENVVKIHKNHHTKFIFLAIKIKRN